MSLKSIFLITLSTLLTSVFFAQDNNWYHGEKTKAKPYNINTDWVYENVLKNKKGKTVVVAVIDSGVDIEHEDLDDVIWINTDEIPNNGIDDDNNGYIDDINGWNFIGGQDGRQVAGDTYEMTRSYIKLNRKYENVDPSTLSEKEIEEYNKYNEYGKKIEKEIASAENQFNQLESTRVIYQEIIDYLKEFLGDEELNATLADSLSTKLDRGGQMANNVVSVLRQDLGYIPSLEEIELILLPPEFAEMQDYYGSKFKYHYNINYDTREIVGDDYEDLSNRYYGNNLVEGPDAMHGTHVSGIIAAERNNNMGINGVANNAKIMVIRAVPNGDERDKDVANAIRYAVENGADIINMSFGKGISPNKSYVDDAVRFAEKNDVLIVCAAGNSGEDIDKNETFPNDIYIKPKGFLFWKKKKAKNWLMIGASSKFDNENMVASFSNYGQEEVDIFAPGEFILSTVPNDNYQVSQGTSMAAPVVSGAAALIRSYFPDLSAKQVKEILINSAQPLTTLVNQPGEEKLISFDKLSVSGGILDIKKALEMSGKMKGKKKNKTTKT